MKILVTGAAGQLGVAMVRVLSGRHDVVATSLEDLDVRDDRAVAAAVESARPDAIVNCSAYTDVDGAEDEPVEALAVNAFSVRSLAAAAARSGCALVHYSTDFVFDGRAAVPYTETDAPNPRSTYACSKLIGEWFAQEAPRHYVLRVESLFGGMPAGPGVRRTSVDRIVDAIAAGQDARVFVDRTVSPSYTADVTEVTRQLLEERLPGGLYHCVNSGSCTWYDLAAEVARQMARPARLVAVPVADVKLRAERPKYCALSNRKLAGIGIVMPPWQDAISRYLRARGAADTSAPSAPRLDRPLPRP
jgi:dTDP-4-dehydrorhamnose reductase